MKWNELLTKLAVAFAVSDVQWRAGSTSRDKKRAQALPYAEPRVYEDRLNALCPGLWSVSFKPWGEGRLICELSITAENERGELVAATRSSTGEENDGFAPGTACEAQAFKRACSRFDLGRYLYDIPISWVDYDQASRKLTETPTLPKRFHPKLEPVAESVAPRLNATRASGLHRELGKLETVASREHNALATEAIGREVGSFTELTEDEARRVWNHTRRVDAERQQTGHINPERRQPEATLSA